MTVRPVSRVTTKVLPDCTASLIWAVMFTVTPALYEPSALVLVNDSTVGGVVSATLLSIVTEDASAVLAGPEFEASSLTEFAAIRVTTVPSLVQLTVTLMVVPEEAEGVKVHPDEEPPLFEKSPDSMPETDSENASE